MTPKENIYPRLGPQALDVQGEAVAHPVPVCVKLGAVDARILDPGVVSVRVEGKVFAVLVAVQPASVAGLGGLGWRAAVHCFQAGGPGVPHVRKGKGAVLLKRKFMSCSRCKELGQQAELASDWLLALL